jgi:hypothetical protein
MWPSFHARFVVAVADALMPLVRPRYRVDVEVALYIDDGSGDFRKFAVADVGVADPTSHASSAAVATIAAPVTATLPRSQWVRRKHVWLTVRDRGSRDVVTVIELLSPANKPGGSDAKKYAVKRKKVLRSAASLVEIDLLRGGGRLPPTRVPPSAYAVLVSRPAARPQVDVWPIPLRAALPPIPIPLRPGEPEPQLDLKPPLDRVYDAAAYADVLYEEPPDPPLSPDDAEWAHQFLPPRG